MIPRTPPDEYPGPTIPAPLRRGDLTPCYRLEETRYSQAGIPLALAGEDFDEHDLNATADKYLAHLRSPRVGP